MGAVHLCKGGATNTHECGEQGGTKLLGDPFLHMHYMSLSVENQTMKTENDQKMRIACLPTTTISS